MTPAAEEPAPSKVLFEEIAREADLLRLEGRLPPGFEDDLERRWEAIAADKASLEAPFETAPDSHQPAASAAGATGQLLERAMLVARRGAAFTKRVVGPPARSFERRSAALAIRLAEDWATRSEIVIDRGRRLGSASPAARRLTRVAPLARTYSDEARTSPQVLEPELGQWLAERLFRRGVTEAVQVESGHGELLRTLAATGMAVRGADPDAVSEASAHIVIRRAGGFEYLGRAKDHSLQALVLTKMTDRVRPSSARSLVQLSSRKLASGGMVAIVSVRPDQLVAADPIGSDLSARRPLHPVTWCHLLSRFGFGEISVNDDGRYSHFVVMARSR